MIYITLLLFVRDGKEQLLNEYESKVLPLLTSYGGRLLYRIRPQKGQHIVTPEHYPYEVHIVSFPSVTDFEQYKADDVRKSYSYLYTESVEKAILIQGVT